MTKHSNDISATEAALVAAFRGALAEHKYGGPSGNFENVTYAWETSTAVAENELSQVFPAPNAQELAEALARAARALAWGDLVSLPDGSEIYITNKKARAMLRRAIVGGA